MNYSKISFFLAVSLSVLLAKADVHASALTKEQVVKIAERYISVNKLATKPVRIGTVTFDVEQKFWIVSVKPTSDDDSHFGLIIYDQDPSHISLQKGL